MDGAPNISYFITYQSVDGSSNMQTKNSTENGTELPGLASGTLYNFTITTIGPQNLNSATVWSSSYTRKFLQEQIKTPWYKIWAS